MNPESVGAGSSFYLVATVKILAFLILVIYLVFSLIVVKQVQTMTTVLTTKLGKTLKALAIGHALLAVLTFLMLMILL